jgi:hypothetical protein
VYRQLIISIIKEFILEKLDLETLLLDKEEDSLSKLVALKCLSLFLIK